MLVIFISVYFACGKPIVNSTLLYCIPAYMKKCWFLNDSVFSNTAKIICSPPFEVKLASSPRNKHN